MSWIYVLIAGLLETAWAAGLKLSHGFTRLVPSILTFVCMAISFLLLSLAMRKLPMGTAYAVWTGIGAAGAIIVGIIFFAEPVTPGRMICLALILTGIIGLRVIS